MRYYLVLYSEERCSRKTSLCPGKSDQMVGDLETRRLKGVLDCVTEEDKDWGEMWSSCPSRLAWSTGYRLAPPTREEGPDQEGNGAGELGSGSGWERTKTHWVHLQRQALCHRLVFDKDASCPSSMCSFAHLTKLNLRNLWFLQNRSLWNLL